MRILVANWQDRLNPKAGGAELHLHEIFGRLASRGHRIELVASGWKGAPSEEEVDGIRVLRVSGRHGYALAARGTILRRIREEGEEPFDLLLEDLNKIPLFTPAWSPIPVGLLVHHLFGLTAFREASPPVAAATWLLERPIPRVYRRTPAVAVSESTRDDLIARGLPADGITVIHNGVDAERLRPDPEVGEFPDPTVLYLGRLQRYKGVELLLRATHRLRKEGMTVRLIIAGRGKDEPRLRRIADRLGIVDLVDFRGYVSEEEKVRLLRRSWIHALASPREGWGISILEAAACGTPTVASDAPGIRDAVRRDRTGRLVPHGDVTALAGAFRDLLLDPSLRRRMGEEARRHAEALSWDTASEAMEEWLRRIGEPRRTL